MQLLSRLQLQDRLGAESAPRILSAPGPQPARVMRGVFLTRGFEFMYSRSTVLVAAGSLCLTLTLVLARAALLAL